MMKYMYAYFIFSVFSHVSGKSKLAKRIQREVIKVRRKLALQKGQKTSDLDETVDTGNKLA